MVEINVPPDISVAGYHVGWSGILTVVGAALTLTLLSVSTRRVREVEDLALVALAIAVVAGALVAHQLGVAAARDLSLNGILFYPMLLGLLCGILVAQRRASERWRLADATALAALPLLLLADAGCAISGCETGAALRGSVQLAYRQPSALAPQGVELVALPLMHGVFVAVLLALLLSARPLLRRAPGALALLAAGLQSASLLLMAPWRLGGGVPESQYAGGAALVAGLSLLGLTAMLPLRGHLRRARGAAGASLAHALAIGAAAEPAPQGAPERRTAPAMGAARRRAIASGTGAF